MSSKLLQNGACSGIEGFAGGEVAEVFKEEDDEQKNDNDFSNEGGVDVVLEGSGELREEDHNNEDNEDDDDDDLPSDFSDTDIMLCDYKPRQENALIPKLFLPETFSNQPMLPVKSFTQMTLKVNTNVNNTNMNTNTNTNSNTNNDPTINNNTNLQSESQSVINNTNNTITNNSNNTNNNNDVNNTINPLQKITNESKQPFSSNILPIKKPSNTNTPKSNRNNNIENSKRDNDSKKNSEADNKNSFSKIQLAFENILKKKYLMYYKRMSAEKVHSQSDLLNSNLFYFKERNSRLLYYDPELQSLIISLIMCLILTPSRGTFEETYCSSHPYEDNKINILFILHHHVNHPDNQHIIYLLLKLVSDIQPFGCGQRLLKLLVTSLFNPDIYDNWKKIGVGTYGMVYQCSTHIAEPSHVAIKKMNVSENIFDKCVLYDIFTEITALESFRLEGCVTQLYDYGVDKESYYIVMKLYPNSLRQWRINQKKPLSEMLSVYLNIFRDILKTLEIIHEKFTTHYDLKCDNVVIEGQSYAEGLEIGERGSNEICVKIADFGEAK